MWVTGVQTCALPILQQLPLCKKSSIARRKIATISCHLTKIFNSTVLFPFLCYVSSIFIEFIFTVGYCLDIGSWREDWTSCRKDRELTVPGMDYYKSCFPVSCVWNPVCVRMCKQLWPRDVLLNLLQADNFHRHGRELRRKMWLQNLRFKLMVGGGIVFLILILWLMVCRGFKC